jgi:hypothetical protein
MDRLIKMGGQAFEVGKVTKAAPKPVKFKTAVSAKLPGIVIDFPKGEFTTSDLADSTKKTPPFVYLQIKAGMAANMVREVRRESRGKGRQTVIYSKI